ncbi:MAG: class I SAM-dependent methyltransferase [Alphaproteobacteria bacterium]|nr:class I SAM-dependent methyltransferase [Alphaproteobacteria bacterium]
MREQTPSLLNSKLYDYYASYYRDELGLDDWKQRVERRLLEEEFFAAPRITWLREWIGLDIAGKSALVVGAGTGAESLALTANGAKVVAIEPFSKAVEVLTLRSDTSHGPRFLTVRGEGEALPFSDQSFDIIYCFAVLEHTRNPLFCVDEMLRALAEGGTLFIEVPDYRFPYDGHYKIPWIPFSPQPLVTWYLKLLGRPAAFSRTLRYLSFPMLRRHFNRRRVAFLRYHTPLPDYWRTKSLFWRLIWHLSLWTGIVPNQTLIVRKIRSSS